MERPVLNEQLAAQTFRDFYYLKEELVAFCKEVELQATGSKEELTNRIAHYLETGEKTRSTKEKAVKTSISLVHLEDTIEENFVCSQVRRTFYQEYIGQSFSFNVRFQNWLKSNAGKTYEESIEAYHIILADKEPTTIGKQFEYNTYIRAIFADNSDITLKDAIKCWQYKKARSGHNQYEEADLIALEK